MRCQRSEPEQAKKISIVGEGGTAGDGSQVPPGRMASPGRGRLVWNAGAPSEVKTSLMPERSSVWATRTKQSAGGICLEEEVRGGDRS